VFADPSSSPIAVASSSHAVSPATASSTTSFDESSAEIARESSEPSAHSFHSAPTLDELPDDGSDSEPPPHGEADAADDEDEADDDLLDNGDLPGFTISDPGEPVPRAPAPRAAGERERGERGGRR